MVGQVLGKYRVVEKLGEGGMGIVYRAQDEGLNRNVAVKILPPGALTDEVSRKRFRKEALTLAKLNHPNIESLYDLDNKDGVDFLVMEYVPGATLAERLAGGALPEKEVLTLGMQVAAALEEAHEQGVVHRDLKPGNIGVTPKGQVKVLDFGLAKVLPQAAEVDLTASLTETPAIAGTLPYMPPEQLRGEPADTRADIYALGVVLYEMATGQRPFREQLVSRLTDAILHQLPSTPRTLNARISPELERIILKCLEKEQENRYQSAKELRVDLRRLLPSTTPAAHTVGVSTRLRLSMAAGLGMTALLAVVGVAALLNIGGLRDRLKHHTVPAKIESLAVLPLENLSRDPEQEYFADGMTEALITELAQISVLKVISRTSVMQYKGARKPLPQIAKELNVDAIVEGSVQRSGDRVGITVQLIYAPTDRHLWAKPYDRDLRDVLTLQHDVARAIAEEIRVRLTPQEQTHLATARPVDREAYEAYLKGRYYSDRRTKEGLEKGIMYFQKATNLDPNYALAYAGLADSYASLGGPLGFLSPRNSFPRAKAATLRALEIDGTLAEAHSSLAEIRLEYEWDWPGAEQEFKRAIELNPNYAHARQAYGTYLEALGQFNEAVAERKRAQELDPLSAFRAADLGYPLYYAGHYEQALEQYRRALDLDPNFYWAHVWIGQVYVQKGMYEEAIVSVNRALASSAGSTRARATLGYIYGVSGKRVEAFKVLRELNAQSKKGYVSPYFIALVYAGLGQKDKVLESLERAYEERHPYLILLKVEPVFAGVRSDSRFQDLLRRIGLPP